MISTKNEFAKEPGAYVLSGSDADYFELRRTGRNGCVMLMQKETLIENGVILFSEDDSNHVISIIDGLIHNKNPCHNFFYSKDIDIEFMFSKNEYE